MLLSNLTGQKTITRELKVPASNNSTCLCVVGAFEQWSCWRGFAGTPSHHRPWHRRHQGYVFVRSAVVMEVWNYRVEKQAVLRTTVMGWSNIQERQRGRNGDKTLTHTMYWPYCFNLVLMEMENPQCGIIQESEKLKFSLWRGLLKPSVHEYRKKKIIFQFLQTW